MVRPTISDIAAAAVRYRPAAGPFVVGITGSVAAGKSTLAAALAPALASALGAKSLETISTDGFLLPNAVLAERGLEMRKGFPESYDLAELARALAQARTGPAWIRAYSHLTYDVDPAGGRRVSRPEVLLAEGLGLGLERPEPKGEGPLIDCLIFIDAAVQDLEAWFNQRFLAFWEAAEHDPSSFYVRFRNLDRAGASAMARAVWQAINLPNLTQNIAPIRELADIVVVKAADHSLAELRLRPT